MTRNTITLLSTTAALALSAGALAAPGAAHAFTCPDPTGVQFAIRAVASDGGNVIITTNGPPSGVVEVTANPPTTTSSVGIEGCANLGGSVTITTGAPVFSNSGTGIIAATENGPITINQNSGDIVGSAGDGIIAEGEGPDAVTVNTAAGTEVEAASGDFSINAGSLGGNVSINLLGAATGSVLGLTQGTGSVAINVGGSSTITVSAGNGAAAISQDGGAAVVVQSGAIIQATAGNAVLAVATGAGDAVVGNSGKLIGGPAGIFADAEGSGRAVVDTSGEVIGASGEGILAETATGAVVVNVEGGAVSGVEDGIVAQSSAGPVTVTTAAGTTVAGGNIGIVAVSGGTGSVAVVAAGTVANGILAASSGAVAVTTSGVVASAGDAIVADGGGAPVNVNVTGGSVSDTGTGQAILAQSSGGAVTVSIAAGTAVATADAASFAIQAVSAGGGVSVVDGGAVTGGIRASDSGAGVVNVAVAGADANANGPGVETSANGATTIVVAAGGSVLGQNAGVAVGSGGGAVTVTNNGSIGTGVAEHAGIAVAVSGAGALTLNNGVGGVLNGVIAGADHVTFANAGLWQSTGTSNFGTAGGAATNTLTNVGMVDTAFDSPASAAAATVFANLGAFNNGSSSTTGIVSMMNGRVGDTLTISGLFTGAAGHSVLAEDAFLGGAGSLADQLHLLSGSAGETEILINDTNPGLGAKNTSGIILVTGVTKSSDFVIDPATPNYDAPSGGIDHGFFLYRLHDKSGTEELIGSLNVHGGHLPNLLSGVQQIFNGAGLDFLTGAGGAGGGLGFAGNDRLAFNDSDIQSPRVWMTSDNWRPDALTAGRQTLWASQLPGDTAGLASAVEVNQSFLSRSFDGAEPSLTMDTGYAQSTASLVGGMDMVRVRSADSAFVAGVLTGYAQSDQVFHQGGDSVQYGGPIVGLYSSYRSGGLRLDGDVKGDLLKADYLGQTADSASRGSANIFGAELNATYSQALGGHWTLAPIASLSLSTASIRGLQPFGQQVRFSGGQSVLAGMGVRLAGDFSTERWLVRLAATAKVSDEFAGVNTAELVDASGLPITNRLGGVSSDFDTRMDVGKKDGRISGFIDAAYRTSSQVNEAVMTSGLALKW